MPQPESNCYEFTLKTKGYNRFLVGYIYCARRRNSSVLRLIAALRTEQIMQFLLIDTIISAKIPFATFFSKKTTYVVPSTAEGSIINHRLHRYLLARAQISLFSLFFRPNLYFFSDFYKFSNKRF